MPDGAGWRIEFSKGDPIEIRHGAKGDKGDTGAKGDKGDKGNGGDEGAAGDSLIDGIEYNNDGTVTICLDGGRAFKFMLDPDTFSTVINGVRWADANVAAPGKFAAKPTDAGMFYQWNRRVGWSATDPMVNSDGGTAWDNSDPDGDGWAAANDPCPAGWRVPTQSELLKLTDGGRVYGDWAIQDGVVGWLFEDMATWKSLFLPVAGWRENSDGALSYVDRGGYYWSATGVGDSKSYILNFGDNGYISFFSDNRSTGNSVRCVAE